MFFAIWRLFLVLATAESNAYMVETSINSYDMNT